MDPTTPPPNPAAGNTPEAEEEASSGPSLREWLSFGVNALRRNLVLAMTVTISVLAIGSAVVSALPLQYETGFRIFVQEGSAVTTSLASGANPSGQQSGMERGMSEYLTARDNLLSVVREANVFDTWPQSRPLPLRVKDRISESLFGPPSRPYMDRSFAELLSTNVRIAKDGDSMRVFVQWRDPRVAYELARLLQRNFLAARAATDFGPIQRALPFLEAQLEQADQAIEAAVQQIQAQKEYAWQANATAAASAQAGLPAGAVPSGNLGELTRSSSRLAEVRRKIKSLSEPLSKRVEELEAQIRDTKPLYGPDHPKLLQLEARLAAAREQPAELVALKQEEAELRKSIASASRPAPAPSGSEEASQQPEKRPAAAPASETPGEMASAQARFYKALAKSEEVNTRLEKARIELAAAQSEFEHRYVVIEPPEVPSRPLKNKKPMFYAGVVLASLLLGVAVAAARELAGGSIRQEWQVRQLGLPVLAVVDVKQLPPGDPS